MERSVYAGSDGERYSEQGVWRRLEAGEWTVCCWDASTGQEWVITPAKGLLLLTPIDSDGATV